MKVDWISYRIDNGKRVTIVKAKADGVEKWQTIAEWAAEPGCLASRKAISIRVSRIVNGKCMYSPQIAVAQEKLKKGTFRHNKTDSGYEQYTKLKSNQQRLYLVDDEWRTAGELSELTGKPAQRIARHFQACANGRLRMTMREIAGFDECTDERSTSQMDRDMRKEMNPMMAVFLRGRLV